MRNNQKNIDFKNDEENDTNIQGKFCKYIVLGDDEIDFSQKDDNPFESRGTETSGFEVISAATPDRPRQKKPELVQKKVRLKA